MLWYNKIYIRCDKIAIYEFFNLIRYLWYKIQFAKTWSADTYHLRSFHHSKFNKNNIINLTYSSNVFGEMIFLNKLWSDSVYEASMKQFTVKILACKLCESHCRNFLRSQNYQHYFLPKSVVFIWPFTLIKGSVLPRKSISYVIVL